MGLERNEVAVFYASSGAGNIDSAALFNDGSARGFPRHPQMLRATLPGLSLVPSTDDGLRPRGLSADVDDDGRDEAIVVTPTGVVVADCNGVTLTQRIVYSYPSADWFDAATGDLDHNGRRQIVISRQVGDLVTIDVLYVWSAADASVTASVEVPGVSRHALAVAPAAVGERPLVHLLTTQTPSAYREPAELLVYALESDALVAEDRVTLAPFCYVGSSNRVSEDGITLLVGDLVATAGSEFFVAAFCDHSSGGTGLGGAVYGAVYNREGAITHSGLVGGPFHGTAYTVGGRVRPPAALGYFDRVSADSGVVRYAKPVVAWNDGTNTPYIATFSSLNTSGTASIRWEPGQTRADGHTVITALAARDLDGDGVDEIVSAGAYAFNACSEVSPCLIPQGVRVTAQYVGVERPEELFWSDQPMATLSGPVIAVGDLDQDSVRVRSTGNVYRFLTGAQVNAVVAAPPTWDRPGVRHADGSETTFGQSESSGVTHGGSLSYGGSMTVGIGVSLYKLLELYGEIYAWFGVTHTWEIENSVTVGQAINAGSEADLVAYSRAIYVQHEYEVVAHPDPTMIGQRVTIDEVDSVVQATTSLSRFYATVPNAELLVPPTLLAHTVGQPATYDAQGRCTPEGLTERIGTGAVSAVYESPSLTEVGDAASGSRSVSVDVGTQTETGVDATFELGAMVGATLVVGGTVTAYVGGGYAYRNTVGSDASYGGSVGVIAEGYGNDTRFQWGLCLFQWADREVEPLYATYPVVTYVVKRY